MEDDLSVKLQLDTTPYENSMNDALKQFSAFQNQISSKKLGFNSNQIAELSKVFTDIRKTATNELNKIASKIDTVSTHQIKLGIDRDILKKQLDDATANLNATPKWQTNAYGDALKEVNKAQAAFKDIEIKLDVDDVELDKLNEKYKFITDELKANPLEFDYEASSLQKFNNEIDNIKNNTKRTGEEFDNLDQKAKKVARTSTRLNLMGRIMSQIKNQIAMAINPLNWFRKAWNEIISTDSSRFGATFKQIGENILNFVKPAIEKLAMWFLKLISYINIFTKAAFGLDLFAKTAKSGASAVKSGKELQKITAGFDEINDIGQSNSAGNATSFDEADIKLDPKTVTTVEKIGKAFKDFATWIKDNWMLAVGILVGGIVAIGAAVAILSSKSAKLPGTTKFLDYLGKGLKNLLTLGGVAVVLLTLAEVLKQISLVIQTFSDSGLKLYEVAILLGTTFGMIAAGFALIAAASKLMDFSGIAGAIVILGGFALILKQVSNLLEVFTKTGLSVGEMAGLMATIFVPVVALMGAVALLGPLMTAGLIPFVVVMGGICALLAVLALTLPTILDAAGKFITTIGPTVVDIISEIAKGIANLVYALGVTLPPIINSVGTLFTRVFDGISKVVSTVGNTICKILNTTKSLVVTVLDSIVSFINKLGPAINNFVDNCIKAVTKLINFIISGIEYLINTLVIGAVNKLISSINSIGKYVGFTIPKVNNMSIPRFVPRLNTGTDYVPNDMLAVIHQGEAVIPKQFNDKEYFGTNDNNSKETNSLLKEVIYKLDNINFNPYTTVKDVGEAAVGYIKKASRQLGRSVV